MDSEGEEWMRDHEMLRDDHDEHCWGRIVCDDSWDRGDVMNAIFEHADSRGNRISTTFSPFSRPSDTSASSDISAFRTTTKS